jgi:hypothetical protein
MEMWLIVLGCILLRAHYVANTVYNVRAYDWDGHIQYISYIVDHMQLPPVTLGWETTQAPLYYVIAALWTKAGIWVGRFPTVFPDLKLLSFLLSIATMGAAAWLSFVIFPRKTAERARLLFIGLVGTLPSLAFFSSRITNDTLVPLVMFVFIGLLLHWWKSHALQMWFFCCVCAGMAFMVKLNAGIFCGSTLFICTLLHPERSMQRAVGQCLIFLVTVFFMAGASVFLRMFDPRYVQLFTVNTAGLNPLLSLPYRLGDFFSFSPIRVLESPFNDPWRDIYYRRFLWEYIFKSAFIGEWQFPRLIWLTRGMLLGGMGVLALSVYGCAKTLVNRAGPAIPLLVTFITGVAAMVAFRLLHSFSAVQDFRLIAHIIAPVAAFACLGMLELPRRYKQLASFGLTIFCVLCAAFVVIVPFYG